MFQWIRTKVKNAVLAGFADAAEYLQRQGADASDNAERLLEERLQVTALPLPAPEAEATTRKRGK